MSWPVKFRRLYALPGVTDPVVTVSSRAALLNVINADMRKQFTDAHLRITHYEGVSFPGWRSPLKRVYVDLSLMGYCEDPEGQSEEDRIWAAIREFSSR